PVGAGPKRPAGAHRERAPPDHEAGSIPREFETVRPKLFIRRKAALELARDTLMSLQGDSPDVHVIVRQRQTIRRVAPRGSAWRIECATCAADIGCGVNVEPEPLQRTET